MGGELPASWTDPAKGTAVYETVLILRPDLSEGEVEAEVGEFRDFLEAQGAQDVEVAVKGRQRMASPIKGEWNGIFASSCTPRPSSAPAPSRTASARPTTPSASCASSRCAPRLGAPYPLAERARLRPH